MKPYYKTELGELFCGDCLTIMKQFPDNHFDLTVTSPPYTTNLLKEKCKYAGKLLKTNTTNPESIRKRNSDKITKETKIKSNVWDFIVAGTNYGHPAIFPEKLANDHILSWSNENDLVLDCFLGSGTTAIACEKLNRRWVGTEISEKYCEIIKKRNDYK